jgi:hypothetical protein
MLSKKAQYLTQGKSEPIYSGSRIQNVLEAKQRNLEKKRE